MNIEDEINYRNAILNRVRNGKSITSSERLWLVTHRIYNESMGYPFLNTDIIPLCSGIDYCISIKIESLTYRGRILPIITVPGGKGSILANNIYDRNGHNISKPKPLKMLGVLLNTTNSETEIIYKSDLGLLGVGFECEYIDDKQQLMIRKSSFGGTPDLAMKSEVLSDCKIRYHCKPPNDNSFNSFVFSIEWGRQKTD